MINTIHQAVNLRMNRDTPMFEMNRRNVGDLGSDLQIDFGEKCGLGSLILAEFGGKGERISKDE